MTPQSVSLSKVGEQGLIDLIRSREVMPARVLCGIGDDAAVFRPSNGKVQLITTDMLVEGTHFRASTPPAMIGRKAMACNLSDIAAMGGRPTVAVIALGLMPRVTAPYVKEVYRGMRRLARVHEVAIVGGDTVKSSQLTIGVTLLGEMNRKEVIQRDGARVGDHIYVTGKLGGSLQSGRHLTFLPRVKEGQYLAKHALATAMMDISDGLVGDLEQMMRASGHSAVLYADQVPCQTGAKLEQALADGEDFELVFTARPRKMAERMKKGLPFKIYPIGEVIDGRGVKVLNQEGQEIAIKSRSYQHF